MTNHAYIKWIAAAVLVIGIIVIIIVMMLSYTSRTGCAADKYNSMTDLKSDTEECKDWEIETRNETNPTVIAAIHGGGIEPGTTEIARELADQTGSGFYSFRGIRYENNRYLHVTAIHYDEPKAQKMVRQSERTITIHKASLSDSDVYIGGRDIALRNRIARVLSERGISVTRAEGKLGGKNPHNIVNQNKNRAGVQMELSNQFVRNFFKDGDMSKASREDSDNWTSNFYEFIDGMDEALNENE